MFLERRLPGVDYGYGVEKPRTMGRRFC